MVRSLISPSAKLLYAVSSAIALFWLSPTKEELAVKSRMFYCNSAICLSLSAILYYNSSCFYCAESNSVLDSLAYFLRLSISYTLVISIFSMFLAYVALLSSSVLCFVAISSIFCIFSSFRSYNAFSTSLKVPTLV